VTGLPTGFTDLDKMINGFNKANLVILAARPSMGKTALAVNIAEYLVLIKDLQLESSHSK
jgi:replicative DNA helicase